ncbi:UBX domain-containing protein 4 [Tripterygium wilfordii]|uniref:UBX domain-containing protein 4 n=1 Tax=Tripterygium wilfordii TaxID=458696 RepID=A0A7J7D4J6_TRIWF|nr:UBX domain-containing protein 1-like isoform X1 [Tripterygium wilfordii]KAF5741277.1 UBX domain-containing protein 4 [Tripterygium wilfordii]
MDIVEVDQKVVKQLEALGFSWTRALQALTNSGNSGLEDAVNWIIDHENDPDIDNMPSVAVNIDIESPERSDNTEEIKRRAQELRKKKEEEEKKSEREREKERIRASKALLEAKRIAEENETKRMLAWRRAEKEEERRAREKILQKLDADKLERRRRLGLSSESPAAIQASKLVQEKKVPAAIQSSNLVQEKKDSLHVNPANPLPVKAITKAEQMRQCLSSLRLNHKNDAARVRRAFQTLLLYVRNVAKNPDVEKFRKIRLGNPLFQDRVGNTRGGIEFLEVCGFERIEVEGGEFLYLPRDKVDMEVLNSAGFQLNSAMTNPFFGLFYKE